MSSTKSHPPLFHVGDWVKFDYGPKKNLGKIVEDRGLLGVAGRRLYRVLVPMTDLGEALNDPPTEQIPKLLDAQASAFEISENELDAVPPPVRQSYEVRYIRQGKTNIWRATTRKNEVLRGVKAEGAVGYSTAFREGEREDDQMFATVTVLLEVDPRFGDSGFHVDPTVWTEMAERAESLAEEMFLSRHPRARVEHAAGV
jgi:hypothetical protein